jgi:predicted DNA-binding protein
MAPKIVEKGELKDKNVNIRMPIEKYEELQEITKKLGIPMASAVRSIIYTQLDKAKKADDPSVFIKIK